MKKTILCVLAGITMLASCGGKNNAGDTAKDNVKPVSEELQWAEGEQVAVAFIGYYTDMESPRETDRYQTLCQLYPQLKEIDTLFQSSDGSLTFLFIPRSPEIRAQIYDNNASSEGNGDVAVLEKLNDGKPFLFNYSTQKYNTRFLKFFDMNGAEVDFRPSIDEKTGKGTLPKKRFFKNISVPVPEPFEGMDSDEDKKYGIKAGIANGRPYVRVDEQAYLASGLGDEALFRIENNAKIYLENINGVARGVKLTRQGGKDNGSPWLTVILDEGDVAVIDLTSLIATGDYSLSKHLPGYKNARSVKPCSINKNAVCEPITTSGKALEPVVVLFNGLFGYWTADIPNGRQGNFQISFTPDFKMTAAWLNPKEGTLDDLFHGNYWLMKPIQGKKAKIGFRLTSSKSSGSLAGEMEIDVSESGKVSDFDGKLLITPTKGESFGLPVGRQTELHRSAFSPWD